MERRYPIAIGPHRHWRFYHALRTSGRATQENLVLPPLVAYIGCMVALRHVCTAIMFLFVVGRLFFVHGCRGGVLLIFALPPVFAYLVTLRDVSRWNRRLAESFLAVLGVGVILAWLDRLPTMFHRLENLSPVDSRTLCWYLLVYLLSLGIVPPYAFGRSLWHGRRGSEAVYSRYECAIGLALWCGYVVLLAVYPSEFLSTMIAVLTRYCGPGLSGVVEAAMAMGYRRRFITPFVPQGVPPVPPSCHPAATQSETRCRSIRPPTGRVEAYPSALLLKIGPLPRTQRRPLTLRPPRASTLGRVRVRFLEGEKGTFYFSVFRGRPRGRRLDSRPSRLATRLTQDAAPNG